MAAADGRSVTEEERSVARGAAAPTVRRSRLWSGVHEAEPTAVAAPAVVAGEAAGRGPRQAGPGPPLPRQAPAPALGLGLGILAIAAAALAIAVVPGGAGTPPPGDPVSASEVRRLANSFASAYAAEDERRISRLLTSDAQRMSPTDGQSGRAAVVAAYRGQFARNQTTGFSISGLEAESGPSGRATARYRASYKGKSDTTGTMIWIVIRERGRPRITLITARPDSS